MEKKVRYQWSEDSEVELCTREDVISDSPSLCYHCDTSIPVGSEMTILCTAGQAPYWLHRACAGKGCTEVQA